MKNIQLPQLVGTARLNVFVSDLEKTLEMQVAPSVHRAIDVADDVLLIVVDAYSAGKQMIGSWGLSFKEHDGLWRKFEPELHDIDLIRAELLPKPEPEVIPEPEPEVIPEPEPEVIPEPEPEVIPEPEPEVNPGLAYPMGSIPSKKKKRKEPELTDEQ